MPADIQMVIAAFLFVIVLVLSVKVSKQRP